MNGTKGRHGSVVENNFWAQLQFRLFHHHSSSGFKAKQKVINPDQLVMSVYSQWCSLKSGKRSATWANYFFCQSTMFHPGDTTTANSVGFNPPKMQISFYSKLVQSMKCHQFSPLIKNTHQKPAKHLNPTNVSRWINLVNFVFFCIHWLMWIMWFDTHAAVNTAPVFRCPGSRRMLDLLQGILKMAGWLIRVGKTNGCTNGLLGL